MPEVHFVIRWPDDSHEACYSPSTVIRDHLGAGVAYRLAEFLDRSRDGLTAASERVRARYGSPCALALAQLARIEVRARDFAGDPDGTVIIESL